MTSSYIFLSYLINLIPTMNVEILSYEMFGKQVGFIYPAEKNFMVFVLTWRLRMGQKSSPKLVHLGFSFFPHFVCIWMILM